MIYIRIQANYLPGRDLLLRPLIIQLRARNYVQNHSIKSEPLFETNHDLAMNAYLEAFVLPIEKYYSVVMDMDTKQKPKGIKRLASAPAQTNSYMNPASSNNPSPRGYIGN